MHRASAQASDPPCKKEQFRAPLVILGARSARRQQLQRHLLQHTAFRAGSKCLDDFGKIATPVQIGAEKVEQLKILTINNQSDVVHVVDTTALRTYIRRIQTRTIRTKSVDISQKKIRRRSYVIEEEDVTSEKDI